MGVVVEPIFEWEATSCEHLICCDIPHASTQLINLEVLHNVWVGRSRAMHADEMSIRYLGFTRNGVGLVVLICNAMHITRMSSKLKFYVFMLSTN